MVWFQCEDCGENLKKPKLPNHFRICSAAKLSCIDCGEMFGQASVQSHTQCITEAEKYGPKGQGKVSNGATPKQNKDVKKGPDIDINVGLSQRPPWFCSLCNTNATSQQTLLLHADGKKHRAKARAFHTSKEQPKQTDESMLDASAKEQKVRDRPKYNACTDSEIENGKLSSKKQKRDASGTKVDDGSNAVERVKAEEKDGLLKKVKLFEDHQPTECGGLQEAAEKNIKWKKLIKSALRSNDGVLKMRKLKQVVLKSLQGSGMTEDETELSNMLEQKINSSSKFTIDGKHVRLVAKN